METNAIVMFLLVGWLVTAAYVTPSIIAAARAHHNAGAIFALNLLLGWTFVGWVAAIVWALTEVHAAKTS
jgi:hypothetical protein